MKLRIWSYSVMLALMGCGQAERSNDRSAAHSDPRTTAEAELSVGSMAPEFELPGSDGKTHKLSNYRGEHVVLAFFPKAFTSG